MRLVITGADGFLGWHVRCQLRGHLDVETIPLGRGGLGALAESVQQADVVLHLAGVNRGGVSTLLEVNTALAEQVAAAVRGAARPVRVVYANSTQAGNGSAYGASKAAAAQILGAAAVQSGSALVDVRLPNLFGEHAQPDYNSFVATFCRDLAEGRTPLVEDRQLTLMHAQQAAAALLDACRSPSAGGVVEPVGESTSVSDVLRTLEGFVGLYATGDVPPLRSAFETALFNTYRAQLFPGNSPIALTRHADRRGSLVECVRAHAGSGQTFVSTSVPGVTRGEHFHLRKVERFVVLRGAAEIALRRMYSTEVVRFQVSGTDPVAVDMPTMWAHCLTNIGRSELVTMFWTDSVYDPAHPDTYAESVDELRRPMVAMP